LELQENLQTSMNTKLYVGNLNFSTTENDLQDAFQKCGAVTSVNLIMDRTTGQSKGFAFVEMSDSAGFTAAIGLNGTELNGRSMTVAVAGGSTAVRGAGLRVTSPGAIIAGGRQ